MQFDETNKVIISTMDKDEARAYICFKGDERIRHSEEVEEVEQIIHRLEYWRPTYWRAEKEFWQSAILRHEEDIKGIDVLIKEVRHWFKEE